MKLPLEQRPFFGQAARWRESLPFVENKAGLLIHRPRVVNMHRTISGTHISVKHHCGSTHSGGYDKLVFLDAPPEDSLLCQACEARAVMAGLPSASEIAGRHVHIGKLKAVRTCCKVAQQ